MALRGLDRGFWVLTARDGTTARLLNVDAGTNVRPDAPSGRATGLERG